MKARPNHNNQKAMEIVFTSAFDLLFNPPSGEARLNVDNPSALAEIFPQTQKEEEERNECGFARERNLPHLWQQKEVEEPAIKSLRFPFCLKADQIKAVEAWMENGQRGSIIYGSGTGKTEIAFECARQAAEHSGKQYFQILVVLPRIVLIEQNYRRLVKYGISREKIGQYFGEQKEIREITLCTYHSVKNALDLVRGADMIIFDEVHLASSTARTFSAILGIVSRKENNGGRAKALLGLTATIDEQDERNYTIISVLPPVRKYLIQDAVRDGRLARPIIIPLKVTLTEREQAFYDMYSEKIRRISARFQRYDFRGMMALLKLGGFPSWQARAWFLNVRKRKSLLAAADNKLARAAELIAEKHRDRQKVMVFSETLDSVRKLKKILADKGIESVIIDGSMPSLKRQRILSQWGTKFYSLLSVHTLEIGYDVPEVDVEIILASTSNMNQVVQRIGRVLRKFRDKEHAFVYVVYVADTKDNSMFSTFKKAIESTAVKDLDGDNIYDNSNNYAKR